MSHRLSGLRAAIAAIAAIAAAVAAVAAVPLVLAAAPSASPDIFNAALCKPPFTSNLMDAIYNAAKAADPKPDSSMLGAAVYRLPERIRRDGFTTQHVVFVATGIGVLVEGEVAEQLAKRYEHPRARPPAGRVVHRLFAPGERARPRRCADPRVGPPGSGAQGPHAARLRNDER
ncbi:hypothetical protein [Burkholderia sp. AU19243]|uniref:hypothetical protein n=1 Tax=Burkholderia sp. AU19243 TaxID=2824810 RepID=UPI0020123BBF|nr:hypothetical protein [Burkholderia sp. AU19243]